MAGGAVPARRTRVLLVDDHRVITDAVASILDWTQDLETVGRCHGAGEVLPLAASLDPDVVVMNLLMPDHPVLAGGEIAGIVLTELLRAAQPSARVLILTTQHGADLVARARAAGAAGYLHKTASADEFLDAVRVVASGGAVWPPEES